MKVKGFLATMAAGAALGAAAGMAARDSGMINTYKIKSKMRRAAQAMEDMSDKL